MFDTIAIKTNVMKTNSILLFSLMIHYGFSDKTLAATGGSGTLGGIAGYTDTTDMLRPGKK
jgi:hypothetical protein